MIIDRMCLVFLLISVALVAACDDDIGSVIEKENNIAGLPDIVDVMEPLPGNNGIILFTDITTSQVVLNWTKALDDVSMQVKLKYQVFISDNNDIENYGQAKINGILLCDWTTNINIFTVKDLNPDSLYYFNVMVTDEQGNVAKYVMAEVKTSNGNADTEAPVPGNGGLITFTGVSTTGVVVNWAKATDNVTSQANLTYQLYISTNADISNYGQAQKNGTLLLDWTPDKNSFDVNGLNSGTVYYFNVMVSDEQSNIAKYTMASVSTQ